MSQEHDFAPFVRILGKGKSGTRSLTREEATQAMGMILDNKVRPEQLGAFLMLLRVKEETAEELAGFADAVRARYSAPDIAVDLDWSSYAGKKRRHPWFLLAALCLASHGYRVFMHGSRGHTPERIYTEDMLALFGLTAAQDWEEAKAQLDQTNFTYMAIEQLCPPLGEIIQLRSVLGLRSPVHTFVRMLNPLHAKCSIDGVFHPPYGPMHQQTAQLLGFERNLTIKGDGGEAEAKPDGESALQWMIEGELTEEAWPRVVPRRYVKEETLSSSDLVALWDGTGEHEYGQHAVISTLALSLKLLGKEGDQAELLLQAQELWQTRKPELFRA